MTTMDTVRERAGDAKDQIEKLRAQVEALMNERVSPAVSDAARSGFAMARDQKEAVSNRVREQPMVAILIAGAAGFLLGRLFR